MEIVDAVGFEPTFHYAILMDNRSQRVVTCIHIIVDLIGLEPTTFTL